MECTPIGTMFALAPVLLQLLAKAVMAHPFLAIPYWVFPTGTGSSARHQSRPDAVYVRSIPGRPTNIDPTEILPQDMDVHFVKFKFCPDTNPFPTPEAETAQHTNTIYRLKARSLRNPTGTTM
eukprot:1158866-Pelagomonas_calceolata.AAC.12